MKKIRWIMLISCFIVFMKLETKATIFNVTNDTIIDTTNVAYASVFDSVIVHPGVTLQLTHKDTSEGWKSKWNLVCKYYFDAQPGSVVKGVPGLEGFIVVYKNSKIINNSGRDSIRNVSLNIVQKGKEYLRIQGYPSTFINVLAGESDRHIVLDTTTTFLGRIFDVNPISQTSLLLTGDTLILGDTAWFAPYNNYPRITGGTGSVVKRIVSASDIDVWDTIPIGIVNKLDSAMWIYLKLNSGVSLGANPYITYEIVDSLHPMLGSPANFLNKYLRVYGNDISNLSYDLKWEFIDRDVVGSKTKLVNGFYNTQWNTDTTVDVVNNLIVVNNATTWGDFTAIGGLDVLGTFPANGATGIAVDSVPSFWFSGKIDSIDFSGIKFYDPSKVEVSNKAFFIIDILGSDLVAISHDSLDNNKTYTIQIPAGSLKSSVTNVVNYDVTLSFTTEIIVNIEQEGEKLSFSLYPNPLTGNNLSINLEENAIITILDENGKEVKQLRYSGQGQTIDLSGIDNGLYIIWVQVGESQVSQKLLIQR